MANIGCKVPHSRMQIGYVLKYSPQTHTLKRRSHPKWYRQKKPPPPLNCNDRQLAPVLQPPSFSCFFFGGVLAANKSKSPLPPPLPHPRRFRPSGGSIPQDEADDLESCRLIARAMACLWPLPVDPEARPSAGWDRADDQKVSWYVQGNRIVPGFLGRRGLSEFWSSKGTVPGQSPL